MQKIEKYDIIYSDIKNDKIRKVNRMKKGLHPEYNIVVFEDMAGNQFLTRSTKMPKETTMYEGKEYPVIKIAVSSASHPFYTGEMRFVDTAGRVDKFNKRYNLGK